MGTFLVYLQTPCSKKCWQSLGCPADLSQLRQAFRGKKGEGANAGLSGLSGLIV